MRRNHRLPFFVILAVMLLSVIATAQTIPWFQWTFLPPTLLDEIIGESSGETAMSHTIAMAGFNRDRSKEEYAGTFFEAEYVLKCLKEYGYDNAEILRYPGRKTWDGIRGELWEISPGKQKLASYTDMRAMLAPMSTSADVTAELIWVGEGRKRDLEGLDVKGKIVVTSMLPHMVQQNACLEKGAEGVISYYSPRPLEAPLAIPWLGLYGKSDGDRKFAFNIPPREGIILRDRLLRGSKIVVHALVEAEMRDIEIQDVVCSIPGETDKASEIILSAHLFEGYSKQGANDNISGSAALLEMARILKRMIEEGRLPRPKRGIRFIWVPEYSGTIAYVNSHLPLMKRTLCNINLDMVGLSLTKSRSYMTMIRTSYGNPHYINDIMENFYRYIGECNRIDILNGYSPTYSRRIVAPSGSEDPFYYNIGMHNGGSDHAVFCDWGVGVPGIIMNTWPDYWYHTSEDRPDKMDSTQLKRAVIIGAAAAYTIATADEKTALRIGGEIVSNASHRIGYQLARGLEEVHRAAPPLLLKTIKKCRGYIESAKANERNTLNSLIELTENGTKFHQEIPYLLSSVEDIARSCLTAFDVQVRLEAESHGIKTESIILTDQEKHAAGLIPKPMSRIKEKGYQGYSRQIQQTAKEIGSDRRKDWPSRFIIDELHLLCNGKNSVLDIKKMLDTQFRRETELDKIITYLQVLEKAGVIKILIDSKN